MENNIKLLVNNISVVYSDVIQVLKGVSLIIRAGQIVSLLGSNGAGKTTTEQYQVFSNRRTEK